MQRTGKVATMSTIAPSLVAAGAANALALIIRWA